MLKKIGKSWKQLKELCKKVTKEWRQIKQILRWKFKKLKNWRKSWTKSAHHTFWVIKLTFDIIILKILTYREFCWFWRTDGQTDGRTDGQTNGQTNEGVPRASCKPQKLLIMKDLTKLSESLCHYIIHIHGSMDKSTKLFEIQRKVLFNIWKLLGRDVKGGRYRLYQDPIGLVCFTSFKKNYS